MRRVQDYQISSNKIHATLLAVADNGVLLLGKSGTGKSDLALRMIEHEKAVLVADDVVCLNLENGRLYGQADDKTAGLLEVRGLGVIPYPYRKNVAISLVVELVPTAEEVERFPQKCKENILGLEIPKIALYAKHSSAVEKLCVGVRLYAEM